MITIGMPHFNDFDGAYFTLQALRLYHDLSDVELLVVDNEGSDRLEKWLGAWKAARYVKDTTVQGTAFAKNKVFEHAEGDFVLCIDCHVLLMPGVVKRLVEWVAGTTSKDLYYGCLGYDNLTSFIPEMKDTWRGHMWGVWGDSCKEEDLPSDPMEIWGHGGGCFGSFKEAWLGFHKQFRGFGGEEGYLPEKYRRNDRKVWCLPWLKWIHRFNYPGGTGYRLDLEDRIHNYLVGHMELGLDEDRLIEHFGKGQVEKVKPKIKTLPGVVCCVPTYGRFECLQESVESFLRQDYKGDKKLLVFNDDPRVEYSCDYKDIIIINLSERCQSLGYKFNMMIDEAIRQTAGDWLIMVWPQDDIMLPWALSEAVNSYQHTNCGCAYPMGRWFSMKNKIEKFEPTAISPLVICDREFYESMGGYADLSVGEDINFMARARKATGNKCIGEKLDKKQAYHIYRWANQYYHISGYSPDQAWEKCREEVENTMSAGRYKIKPGWDSDYVKLVTSGLT